MVNYEMTFQLQPYQVPPPPVDKNWVNILRWMICVMDKDPWIEVEFIAGFYNHCVRFGHLTSKQNRVASDIHNRVLYLYQAQALDCQMPTEWLE